MSRALVEAVAARIESVVGANRTVFRNEVPEKMPDGSPIPERYIVVRAGVGTDESFDLADSRSLRDSVAWISSVAPSAYEALWGAEKQHEAVKNWRPFAGAWKPESLSSMLPERDESLPGRVFSAVEQWGFTYQV